MAKNNGITRLVAHQIVSKTGTEGVRLTGTIPSGFEGAGGKQHLRTYFNGVHDLFEDGKTYKVRTVKAKKKNGKPYKTSKGKPFKRVYVENQKNGLTGINAFGGTAQFFLV